MEEIIERLANTKIEEALQLISTYKEAQNNNNNNHNSATNDFNECTVVELYLNEAKLYWIIALLSERTEDKDKATRKIEETRKRAVTKKSLKGGIYEQLLHAETEAMTAVMQLRAGSYVPGGWNLRKSWKSFAKTLHLIEEYERRGEEKMREESGNGKEMKEWKERAMFGVGSFHFFVSLIPPSFQFLLQAIGFEGELKKGFNELIEAVKINVMTANTPMVYCLLLWIETFFYEDMIKAKYIAEKALQRYPSNSLILYLCGYLYRQIHDIPLAIEYFERSLEGLQSIQQWRAICAYEIGDCHFKRNDYHRAIQYFHQFLENNQSRSYRCFCAYQLGIAYCMIGKQQLSLDHFLNSEKWARKHYSFDDHARRKSSMYYRMKSLSLFDQIFIDASNLRKEGFLLDAVFILCYIIGDDLISRLYPDHIPFSSSKPLHHIHSNNNTNNDIINNNGIVSNDGGDDIGDDELNREKQNRERRSRYSCEWSYSYDEKASARYLRGRLLVELGHIIEAEADFQYVISVKKSILHEIYIIPHCYSELAELSLRSYLQQLEGKNDNAEHAVRNNNNDAEHDAALRKAREYCLAAKTFKNYDFDKPNIRRVLRTLDVIQSLQKEGSSPKNHNANREYSL